MEKVDLNQIFPNLDPEAEPESYPVVSKDLSPLWYSLFPNIYPESPARVIQAYKMLYQTSGPDDNDDDESISEVSESGSSGTSCSDPPTSVTSGEFNPSKRDVYSQAGLDWNTKTASKTHKAIINSCNIDNFLTNLMIQFNRQKYNFNELLKHTGGRGKEVEDFIRELASMHKRHPGVKKPTVGKSIKQRWVDLTKIGKEGDNFIDLQGDEDIHIFNHLDDVTEYHTVMDMCNCYGPPPKVERNDINVTNKFEISQALRGRIRNPDGELYANCLICNQTPVVNTFVFPDTTWILHFVINNSLGAKLNHAEFPATLPFGSRTWFKSYASYWVPAGRGLKGRGHTVSLHFLKNKAYFYDDTKLEGRLYYFGSGPMNKNAWLQHVVYFRQPPIAEE